MEQRLYCIYDESIQSFGSPLVYRTEQELIREMLDFQYTELKKPEEERTLLCKYADDFSLFYVGSFDTTNGRFNLPGLPNKINKLSVYKREAQKLIDEYDREKEFYEEEVNTDDGEDGKYS